MHQTTKDRYNKERDVDLGCFDLLPFLKINTEDKVLDLGCGNGDFTLKVADYLNQDGSITGIDFSEKMIERANLRNKSSKVSFLVADITNLPFFESSFDVVLSNCVINHIIDKEAVYREIYRVLKFEGYFLIADVMSQYDLPKEVSDNKEYVAACFGGAVTKENYLALLNILEFKNVEVITSRKYIKNYDNKNFPLESIIIKGEKK